MAFTPNAALARPGTAENSGIDGIESCFGRLSYQYQDIRDYS